MTDSMPPASEALAAARVIAYAGNLIRVSGYQRIPWPGHPGTSLTLAVCTRAGCEIMRPNLPVYHSELCYVAHARLAGYLYLTGRVTVARDVLTEVTGQWERRQKPSPAAVLAVADGAAEALGLAGARHHSCGYWAEGGDPEARLADMRAHLLGDGACGMHRPAAVPGRARALSDSSEGK